jgi:hypothetical protein
MVADAPISLNRTNDNALKGTLTRLLLNRFCYWVYRVSFFNKIEFFKRLGIFAISEFLADW